MRSPERWTEWRKTPDGLVMDASVWVAKKEQEGETITEAQRAESFKGFEEYNVVGQGRSTWLPDVSVVKVRKGHAAFVRGEIQYSGRGEDNRY